MTEILECGPAPAASLARHETLGGFEHRVAGPICMPLAQSFLES